MLRKTGKWIRRLVYNRSAIRRDASLILSHLPSLPYAFWPLNNEPSVRSERDPRSYASFADWLSAALQVVLPAQRVSCSPGTLVVHPPGGKMTEDSGWFFINGAATAPPVALLNAAEIAAVFGRPVRLLHIPTWGLLRDLSHSVMARTLRKDGRLSRPAFYVIEQALRQYPRVVLVCHSQGTIVGSYIVRKLLRHPHTRPLVRKLEIYCVGGVADSLDIDVTLSREAGHPVPYVEHFANGRDYFSQIGVLSHLDSTAGTVFCIPERSGHLFNEHYLAGIARGDYCNRGSRLYRYTRGRQPSHYQPIQPSARD